MQKFMFTDKRVDHNSDRQTIYFRLLNDETIPDATIQVNNGRILKVHKQVFRDFTSYFEKAFQNSDSADLSTIDSPENVVEHLLQFAYTGIVVVYECDITPFIDLLEVVQYITNDNPLVSLLAKSKELRIVC